MECFINHFGGILAYLIIFLINIFKIQNIQIKSKAKQVTTVCAIDYTLISGATGLCIEYIEYGLCFITQTTLILHMSH